MSDILKELEIEASEELVQALEDIASQAAKGKDRWAAPKYRKAKAVAKHAQSERRAEERKVSASRNEEYDQAHQLFRPDELPGTRTKRRRSSSSKERWFCEDCKKDFSHNTSQSLHRKSKRHLRAEAHATTRTPTAK